MLCARRDCESYVLIEPQGRRQNFYDRRRKASFFFFGLLIITEAIAATSRSSKSRSILADLGSSRLREPDCVCEVLLTITRSPSQFEAS